MDLWTHCVCGWLSVDFGDCSIVQRSPCLKKRNVLWWLSNIDVCNKMFPIYISLPAVPQCCKVSQSVSGVCVCHPRLLGSLGNRPEAVLLGSVAVCFLLLLVADYLGASMELGCFLAGLAIGSQGHSIVEQVYTTLQYTHPVYLCTRRKLTYIFRF